jgi:hypothetical protein
MNTFETIGHLTFLTYLHIRKPRSYLVEVLCDFVEFDEFEGDGDDGTRRLDAPIAVQGVQGTRTVEVETVAL